MAIGTYSELKTAIANWLHRSDLTSTIPDFIALAESRLRHDIRCRAMEQSATGSLSATTVAFPTRFVEARRVMLNGDPLHYLDPGVWEQQEYRRYGAFTILAQNFVFPRATGDYQIDYYQAFAPLSGASDTNWVLTNHPDIYLYSSLVEAALFLHEDPSLWDAKYTAAKDKLKRAEWLFGGPLQIRPQVVV